MTQYMSWICVRLFTGAMQYWAPESWNVLSCDCAIECRGVMQSSALQPCNVIYRSILFIKAMEYCKEPCNAVHWTNAVWTLESRYHLQCNYAKLPMKAGYKILLEACNILHRIDVTHYSVGMQHGEIWPCKSTTPLPDYWRHNAL